ncbi:50S ribosomal protein L4 [Brumimicrobium glaciale]|jgi:large subunit ribosomal protein L4|uniref:Large ribosomal subunit protein uL4 n=1 Tax=Brumimicrobium glaciale TaxID=200475 RepID=A0A4Q4KGZ7_9FLAO|nr:50S ribosomal protein L4 [Brumimicrobium glaciale]RYM32461.1 50S ribosomal protein L4 [Brumimicrobium glaciale]
MEAKVLDTKGKATSDKVTLSDSIYGIEPNDHAIYLDVKQYLANQRQGTHKSKERADITGSTRKIKKQKGTGTARAGSIKSPIFRGGGRAFGPRPRNYRFKLNIKLKRVARRSALSLKAKEENILILDGLKFDTPKTKEFLSVLTALKLENEKVLFVVGNESDNAYKSAKNLKNTKIVSADSLNTYDVLNARKVVIAKDAVDVIEKILN